MAGIPQTYTISDFIEWNKKKHLELSPDFQRESVWTPPAEVFLIDTILNDLPIPQIYFRTKFDPKTQATIREVVDGQQRLRAIIKFASGKMKLTSKSPDFRGKTYGDLSPEDQTQFLSYSIPVVQLMDANDSKVLEIFARLNSYSVKVTPAELRHAKFSEPVKLAIYDATLRWKELWGDLQVVSTRDAVRMKNNSLIAEMFMVLDQGLGRGGEGEITKYYEAKTKEKEEFFSKLRNKLDATIDDILKNAESDFSNTTFFKAPNFLILFSAVAFLNGMMPRSKLSEDVDDFCGRGVDWTRARKNLSEIAQSFNVEAGKETTYAPFVSATKSTTHGAPSRKTRFSTVVRVISKDVISA